MIAVDDVFLTECLALARDGKTVTVLVARRSVRATRQRVQKLARQSGSPQAAVERITIEAR
jgi:hypothetical protein